MKQDKVITEQTKNWQPLMNKLSKRSRRRHRRLCSKRIRKMKLGRDE